MDTRMLEIVLGAVVLVCVFCIVPIVMALLGHQQKMAQMFLEREASQSELAARLASLEAELKTNRTTLPGPLPPYKDEA